MGSGGYFPVISVEWGPRDLRRQRRRSTADRHSAGLRLWQGPCGFRGPKTVVSAGPETSQPRRKRPRPEGGPQAPRCSRLQRPSQGGAERDRVGPSGAERGRAGPSGAELRPGGPERSRTVGGRSRAWPSTGRA
ncbi:hypothetical protein NN561_004139 [Cricetulus griseus]